MPEMPAVPVERLRRRQKGLSSTRLDSSTLSLPGPCQFIRQTMPVFLAGSPQRSQRQWPGRCSTNKCAQRSRAQTRSRPNKQEWDANAFACTAQPQRRRKNEGHERPKVNYHKTGRTAEHKWTRVPRPCGQSALESAYEAAEYQKKSCLDQQHAGAKGMCIA